MSIVQEVPPQRSPHLVISPQDREGCHIVGNQRKQKYLRMGSEESFLLNNFDGKQTYGEIAKSFEAHFREPISCSEIQDFVGLVEKEGLLGTRTIRESRSGLTLKKLYRRTARAIKKQSPLFFRVKLIDPNSILDWLEPRTRFLFSGWLAVMAAVGAVAAIFLTWMFRAELLATITTQFGLRAFFVLWLTTVIVTVLHEFGHGLACKKYGGEVHEMGALWIFFTPCLYCNVSDAWMLPGRWRRLLISMAGTYIDLLIWILAVFAWRLTAPGTALHYVAWIVISSCGVRLAFNLNPLMRLDGYYALGDFLQLPNLRKRGRARMMEFFQSLCWGAAWPKPISSGKTLLAYGITSWGFAVGFLGLLSFKLSTWLGQYIGLAGILVAVSFFMFVTRSLFKGSLGKEFQQMFYKRAGRVLVYGALVVAAMFIPVSDRAGGEFLIKPVVHGEVCAPIAGFLREVHTHEGQNVFAGTVVAMMEVPELSNQISRKQAEIAEVNAELRRLTTGSRAESLHEQKEKIKRAIDWRDLGEVNLKRTIAAFHQELETLDYKIKQAETEFDYRQVSYQKAQTLFDKGGLAEQQLLSQRRLADAAAAELQVSKSTKKTREAEGTMDAEIELARREKELADEQAALALMEAGSRTEDIEAEQARLNRLHEEMRILQEQESKQSVICTVQGTVVTPRLRDRIGKYFERGAVMFVVENLDLLEAEVSVPEQHVESVVLGQKIKIKPRLLPHLTLDGTVSRVAPSVNTDLTKQGTTVTVYCQIENEDGLLRAGMTGYARIYLGEMKMGQWIYSRSMRTLRTEFWW